MTKITYTIGEITGTLYWAVSEHFQELTGQKFSLSEMEATKISNLPNFTPTAKILLSAVAGAVIQHLMDAQIETNAIFTEGVFEIQI